jgi:hypothetical protein
MDRCHATHKLRAEFETAFILFAADLFHLGINRPNTWIKAFLFHSWHSGLRTVSRQTNCNPFGTHPAATRASHAFSSLLAFSPSWLFLFAAAFVKNKNSRKRRNRKKT